MRPMAIDEKLSEQVRAALAATKGVGEVNMFGGVGFLLNGNLVAAASDRGLLVRVGEAGQAEARARGAQPVVMGGRTMKGYVRVTGKLDARAVKSWLRQAVAFVEALPPKKSAAKPVKKSAAKPVKKSKA
jgi:TfoX/Sxy family transcriptional regulator of competence genes